MDLSQLNYLAILVAAISFFVLGSIWYNPKVFGTAWMNATGITEEKAKEAHPGKVFGLSFLFTLIISFTLAAFLGATTDIASGAFYGFLTGFGFVAMSLGVNDMFEQRPISLLIINAGYNIVGYTIVGIILSSWH